MLIIEIIKIMLFAALLTCSVITMNKLGKEIHDGIVELKTINVHLRAVIEWLDIINSKRESETLEIYKDAMDRIMAKSIGQYEAIKQQRESGEPLDVGGRATSKTENQRKQAEKIRRLREGGEQHGEEN